MAKRTPTTTLLDSHTRRLTRERLTGPHLDSQTGSLKLAMQPHESARLNDLRRVCLQIVFGGKFAQLLFVDESDIVACRVWRCRTRADSPVCASERSSDVTTSHSNEPGTEMVRSKAMSTSNPTDTDPRSLEDNALLGIGIVSISALLYSLIPVSLDLSVNDTAPITVGLGVLLGYVLTNGFDRRRLSRNIRRWSKGSINVSFRCLLQHLRDPHVYSVGAWLGLILVGISAFDYITFAFATVFVHSAVASSMFEAWPMLWLFAVALNDVYSHGPRKRFRRPWHTYALMLVAVPAIALVAAAADSMPDQSVTNSGFPILGVFLAALSPVLSSCGAAAMLYTDRMLFQTRSASMDQSEFKLYRRWQPEQQDLSDSQLRDLKSVMSRTSLVAGRAILIVVMLPLAIRETNIASGLFWISLGAGVSIGALLHGPASIGLHEAHFITERREIIAMQYLSPLMALIWIALATGIVIERIDFLIFGTLTVVAINMLTNLDPEIGRKDERPQMLGSSDPNTGESEVTAYRPVSSDRHSLRALVVALLLSGAFVYFRDDLLGSMNVAWVPGNYWAALALAATVFALLLAFRLTRVEGLLTAEDYRTLTLVRRIEMMPNNYFGIERANSKEYLLDWVRLLNRSNKLTDYRHCYNQAHQAVHRIVDRLNEDQSEIQYDQRNEIASIRIELDALANGRQHARELAERIALWLIGAVIIVLALFVPNEISPFASFIADCLAIVLASTVVFLLAHLADLRRSRGDELLGPRDPDWTHLRDGLYLNFRQDDDTTWQRAFSSVVIVGIIGVIAGLLYWSRIGI